jgi:hypothetical protein
MGNMGLRSAASISNCWRKARRSAGSPLIASVSCLFEIHHGIPAEREELLFAPRTILDAPEFAPTGRHVEE